MKQRISAIMILLLIAAIPPSAAQTVYQLPFASTGNSIELTVANTSAVPLSGVSVEVTDIPGWLRF